MVSGFFTSPCDHSRILSGLASEIRIAENDSGSFGFSKKLKMSFTLSPSLLDHVHDHVYDHVHLLRLGTLLFCRAGDLSAEREELGAQLRTVRRREHPFTPSERDE